MKNLAETGISAVCRAFWCGGRRFSALPRKRSLEGSDDVGL
ncbi:hypothetical protein GCWU000341_00175 [Oribacterium sp. oral taxon 078 str. F0262]|nr:hypothetical protein GCWU000341_00175 [Oribacterium sp. oral taxon 078 str. F0262]